MASIFNFKKRKAQKLHVLAQEISDQGNEEKAIELYMQAVSLDPEKSESYYNMGLIYKYQQNWELSFSYNEKAYILNPSNEAICWNLGIAATALGNWTVARKIWTEQGMKLDEKSGPINGDFGYTPVRLNPDEDAEVVWADRIDPVRAKIVSVPLPDSGFCTGDIVLHDGAATGYRKHGNEELPVFNVFGIFEKSKLNTYVVDVKVSQESDIDSLEELCDERSIIVEDWTTSYQMICKACSEGRPHNNHDHEGDKEWVSEHEVAFAAQNQNLIEEILNTWKCIPNRIVIEITLAASRN